MYPQRPGGGGGGGGRISRRRTLRGTKRRRVPSRKSDQKKTREMSFREGREPIKTSSPRKRFNPFFDEGIVMVWGGDMSLGRTACRAHGDGAHASPAAYRL